MSPGGRKLGVFIVLAGAALLGWLLFAKLREQAPATDGDKVGRAAPVEVAPIEHGPIVLRRTFSGALEPQAQFVVAPKVAGRVERLRVNIADIVTRGQVVAELDNEEFVQAVAQARADLEVARANRAEAASALEIAERDLARAAKLRERGVASEVQYDAARADQLAKKVQLEAAGARIARARASLEAANIRLGYTTIAADWAGGDDERVVADRYVDEGQTVSANTELLLIVELQPINGVIYVSEVDYARLHPGQEVALSTDAYPGETFRGRIERIAPVFRQETRQARVELTIDNPGRRLKPGMFIRAEIVLDRLAEAIIVLEKALVRRDDVDGVFVVAEDGRSVAWRPVRVGIREGDKAQVEGEGLSGRVVTLGQQLVDDGSAIIIPDDAGAPASAGRKEAERR
jgi:RND family efflux transporter MFP subunit